MSRADGGIALGSELCNAGGCLDEANEILDGCDGTVLEPGLVKAPGEHKDVEDGEMEVVEVEAEIFVQEIGRRDRKRHVLLAEGSGRSCV